MAHGLCPALHWRMRSHFAAHPQDEVKKCCACVCIGLELWRRTHTRVIRLNIHHEPTVYTWRATCDKLNGWPTVSESRRNRPVLRMYVNPPPPRAKASALRIRYQTYL